MKLRNVFLGVLAVACVLLVSTAWTQQPPAKAPSKKVAQSKDKPADADDPNLVRANDVGEFMRLKLNHSQKVLEGVVTEDFDLIANNAQQMGLLAQDENWRVYQTPEYRHYSAAFQQVAADLTTAAKNKNLDGTALAYVQLTMCCVNCHKYTRGVRQASSK